MRNRHWLEVFPKYPIWTKLGVLLAGLIPLIELIVEYYQQALGFDPLDRITRSTGKFAMIMLLISLAVTPLRYLLTRTMVIFNAGHGKRVSDWNWIIRLRRMIGLLSFFYATLHVAIYGWIDQDANVAYAMRDISERPFLAAGAIAYILLIPLALTANDYAIRRLGKNWRRLHRTVYMTVLLVIVHYWLLTKVGVRDPVPYTLIVLYLLGWRLWFAMMSRKCNMAQYGMEAPERN